MHACYLLKGNSVMLLQSAGLAGKVLCNASLRGMSTRLMAAALCLLQNSTGSSH